MVLAEVDDELPTNDSNTVTTAAATAAAAAPTVPPVALKLVEVQLMIKGKTASDAASIAQKVYLEFREREWPGGGSDIELQ